MAYTPPIGTMYHLYTTYSPCLLGGYIIPIPPFMEPETTIDFGDVGYIRGSHRNHHGSQHPGHGETSLRHRGGQKHAVSSFVDWDCMSNGKNLGCLGYIGGMQPTNDIGIIRSHYMESLLNNHYSSFVGRFFWFLTKTTPPKHIFELKLCPRHPSEYLLV